MSRAGYAWLILCAFSVLFCAVRALTFPFMKRRLTFTEDDRRRIERRRSIGLHELNQPINQISNFIDVEHQNTKFQQSAVTTHTTINQR